MFIVVTKSSTQIFLDTWQRGLGEVKAQEDAKEKGDFLINPPERPRRQGLVRKLNFEPVSRPG